MFHLTGSVSLARARDEPLVANSRVRFIMDAQEKALIRLQILTPISILVSLAANLVAALAIHPTLGQINDDYLTILTPRKGITGFYWLVLYLLEIGYCILLATVRKDATKAIIVNAIGLRFVIANLCMAFWTLFWEFRLFLVSEIFLLVALLLMISIWAQLLLYASDSKKRPMDSLFIQAPVRMFLVLLLTVLVWQNGLLAFRWYKYVGDEPNSPSRPGKWEGEHSKHNWIAFGVISTVGLVNAFVVFISRDFVWAISAMVIYIAMLLKGPKPAQIFIPLVLLSVLQAVALLSSILWYRYRIGKQGGVIALPTDDDDDDDYVHHARPSVPRQSESFVIEGGQAAGPREITE